MSARYASAACLLAACLSACFTEVGNPGKTQQVKATFSIDYNAHPTVLELPKGGALAAEIPADSPSVRILRFYFNVVEANYRTVDSLDGRIWKVPDSMGRSIDFTGRDAKAVLPPVQVPMGSWTIMKLESRIPAHDTLLPDTLDFETFAHRGYIQGIWESGGKRIRFLCQLPDVYRINLVYTQASLEKWRHGDVYDLEFVFYATKWISAVQLAAAGTCRDRNGLELVVIDLEHNADQYALLKASFFKSFNSYKVWKEVP